MHRLLSIALVALSSFGVCQQSSGTIKADIIDGHIFINAKINHKSVRLAVDSGAQMNALVPAAAERLGVKSLQKVSAVGVGAKPVEAYIGRVDLIEVGNSGSVGESVVVIPLPSELECDGLIGYGFLSHFITTIDYAGGTIRFERPDDFKSPTDGHTFPLEFYNGIPGVRGSIEGISGLFSVDTGANGSLAVFGPFVEKNKLRDRYPKRVSTVTGAGVGGVALGDMVRINSVKIGDIELPPLVVNLSKQTSGAFADTARIGNISSDILSRFTVSLDYPGKRLVLVKNESFGKPSEWNRAGFFLSFSTGKPTVIWIIKDSPADLAGVKIGDVVTEWLGKPAADYKPNVIKAGLRGPVENRIWFSVQRAGKPLSFDFKLKELLG